MISRLKASWRHLLHQISETAAGVRMLDGKADEQAAQLSRLGAQVDRLERELRILGGMAVPADALWRGGPKQASAQADGPVFPNSTACRQEMFDQPYFNYWLAEIGYAPRYHRKLWEFVFICQALAERGLLRAGARGLGFGVGEEPLTSAFAARGCHIVATDMAPEAAALAGWSESQQHAAGKEALRRPGQCPDPVFDANVDFQTCDMNAIPGSLSDFDFCWSACALEHLGSIEAGLAFIERSVDCLKPGGYAVHTTEFNLSSNDATLDNAGTVLFRRRDFEALAQRLTQAGHDVAPMDFSAGDAPLDRYIDMPPYRDDPHLRLALEGYAATSFGVIVRKGPG